MALNYIKQSLILVSAIFGTISISAITLLVGISIGIASSAVQLKICDITEVIKKCKFIIIKKRKKSW